MVGNGDLVVWNAGRPKNGRGGEKLPKPRGKKEMLVGKNIVGWKKNVSVRFFFVVFWVWNFASGHCLQFPGRPKNGRGGKHPLGPRGEKRIISS